jgi:hypothetical protein
MIKPVGIERDKQIAEVRGDEVFIECHHDLIPCDCIWEPTRTECGMESPETCKDRQVYDPKPYSTDISCAMELWEEMKGAGLFIVLCNPEKGDILCSVQDTHGEEYYHEGETEADAISGCFLKWKKQVSQ